MEPEDWDLSAEDLDSLERDAFQKIAQLRSNPPPPSSSHSSNPSSASRFPRVKLHSFSIILFHQFFASFIHYHNFSHFRLMLCLKELEHFPLHWNQWQTTLTRVYVLVFFIIVYVCLCCSFLFFYVGIYNLLHIFYKQMSILKNWQKLLSNFFFIPVEILQQSFSMTRL